MDELFEEKVKTAKSIFDVVTAQSLIGLPTFYAVEHMSDDQLAELIEQARQDSVPYHFIKRWLSGELGIAFPDPVPEPLVPLIQDWIGGRLKKPEGSPVRGITKQQMRDAVERIQDNHGGTKEEAKAAIAAAAELSISRVRDIYKGKK